MKEFFVIRVYNSADGKASVASRSFDTEFGAWKEFYRGCGLAVDSEYLTDAVTILTKQGFQLDYKCFEHDAPAPEPEEPVIPEDEVPEEPIEEEPEEEPSEVEGE